MNITDQIMSSSNPLVGLLGDYKNNFVGNIYSMNFSEALVLTNDAWKEQVAGIPHNGFLVATALNPEKLSEAHEFDMEVVLLRVLGPGSLPSDGDILKTLIEHNQRRVENEMFSPDAHDGLDPITHNQLQYGALNCRILGTFYMQGGELRLGSDLENFVSCARMRVFKPRAEALSKIVNHINPEVLNKAKEDAIRSGFSGLPTPIEIGTVRYTSTDRLHRGASEPHVPVHIQPSDFLGRRTAVFGMTRTGKSNMVKTTVASVALAAKQDGITVGQIIFDVNGEYANATAHDSGSSIADVFGKDCKRYRAVSTPGFEDLRTNFYIDCDQALNLLSKLTDADPYRNQTDLEQFLDGSLYEPDATDQSAVRRWKIRRAVFHCILSEAGYTPPPKFKIEFPVNAQIVQLVASQSGKAEIATSSTGIASLTIDQAVEWFKDARATNAALEATAKDAQKNGTPAPKDKFLPSSSKKPWIDSNLRAFLNVLARLNDTGTSIRGWRAIQSFVDFHSPTRTQDVISEIHDYLLRGNIVILDLSVGPVEIKKVLSKRIAQQILDRSFAELNSGVMPKNIVVYVEEAHNLIGQKDKLDDTWPRIAKEGAKARIAFVYATQEPSSVHPNIVANTENWFVTHLNNDDELRALSKFYDFGDFKDSLKMAQDVGFARIKTLSSPFVIPTQIKKFEPESLKKRLADIESNSTHKGF